MPKLTCQRNLSHAAQSFRVLTRWAGDQIIALKRGSQLTLLLVSAFHDPPSAEEFASAYSQILDHLGPVSAPHGIVTRGAAVFIAIGPGARKFAQLKDAVCKASRIMPALSPEPSKKVAASIAGPSLTN